MTDLAKDKVKETRLCSVQQSLGSSTPSNAGSMAIGSTPISITPQIVSPKTDCCNRKRQS